MDQSVPVVGDTGNLVQDTGKTVAVLREVSSAAKSLTEVVDRMSDSLKDDHFQTQRGHPCLELRNLLMLTYLMDVVSIVEKKCTGTSLQQRECQELILRTAETRTSIEKLKPILLKLKYKIEKMVASANEVPIDANDPIHLKPNPQAIVADSEAAGEDAPKANKKYVAPKLGSVPYEEKGEEKKSKDQERNRRRALSSSLMGELRNEFDDAPEEISEVTVGKRRMMKELKARTRYEEENMIRLNVKKQKKRKEQQLLTMGDLGSTITKFDAGFI